MTPGVWFVVTTEPNGRRPRYITAYPNDGHRGPVPRARLVDVDGHTVLRVDPEPPGQLIEEYRGADGSRYRWTPNR